MAKLDYILRVKVKRPGRFQRNVSILQELMFLPSGPPPSSIPSSGSGHCTTARGLWVNNLAPEEVPTIPTRYLPDKIPILMLEARLPSPAILYLEERLPLHLFVRKFPEPTGNLLLIELRSLVISLQTTTTITIGFPHTSWTSPRDLLNRTGLKEVVASSGETEQLSEIMSSALQSVTIPKVTPSFTTWTVKQEHSLQVIAGFSIGNEAKLRVWPTTP
jgi:hypothetical protein